MTMDTAQPKSASGCARDCRFRPIGSARSSINTSRTTASINEASLHVIDDVLTELGALDFLHAGLAFLLHQAREVVGHLLGGDRAIHPVDDQVRRFGPAH